MSYPFVVACKLDFLFQIPQAGPSTSATQLNSAALNDKSLHKQQKKRKLSVATPDVKVKKSKTEKGKAAGKLMPF